VGLRPLSYATVAELSYELKWLWLRDLRCESAKFRQIPRASPVWRNQATKGPVGRALMSNSDEVVNGYCAKQAWERGKRCNECRSETFRRNPVGNEIPPGRA